MRRLFKPVLHQQMLMQSLINYFKTLQVSQLLLSLLQLLKWPLIGVLGIGIATVFSSPTLAQTNTAIEALFAEQKVMIDTLWVLISSVLVFFMNAGFAMLETGVCRRKNAVNVLAKNLIVFSISTIAFWFFGFGIMFGDGNPFWGTQGFFLLGTDSSPFTGDGYRGVFDSLNWAGIPLFAKFFFQLVFAGVTATIVSGAVTERISFFGYFSFSFVLVALAYPMVGHWVWGGGFLSNIGFIDFAGSTVVHSVGGWAALVGTQLLGPRTNRLRKGKLILIPGHNLGMATLGCLILWLGWFGFNGGSLMAMDPAGVSHIVVTTNIAGAAGALSAVTLSWIAFARPSLISLINGSLAGLVAVTASSAYVSLPSAALIGLIGGLVAIVAELMLIKCTVDDPVGVIPVHLGSGIWGTIAVGLFSVGPGTYSWYGEGNGPNPGLFQGGGWEQLGVQMFGILAVALFTVAFSLVIWTFLDYTLGLRVSLKAEKEGLDQSEHGLNAYPEFSTPSTTTPNIEN